MELRWSNGQPWLESLLSNPFQIDRNNDFSFFSMFEMASRPSMKSNQRLHSQTFSFIIKTFFSNLGDVTESTKVSYRYSNLQSFQKLEQSPEKSLFRKLNHQINRLCFFNILSALFFLKPITITIMMFSSSHSIHRQILHKQKKSEKEKNSQTRREWAYMWLPSLDVHLTGQIL